MKVVRKVRFSVLIIVILAGYQWLTAAYLMDIPVQVNQPNGTVIDCFASGDEYHNWLHDTDGYTIIQSPDTGYYTYAIQSGDTVTASGLIVGIDDPSVSGLTPGINISQAEYQQKRASFPVQETRNAHTTGTINNIVIFIHFTGQSEFNENISVYNGWFNSNPSSLKNYFIEASYGQLTVNSFFYPPATNDHVVSWMSPYPREYYLPYSTSNTNGYHNIAEWQSREHDLLRSAVNAVSDQIPDNLNIDANNDGKVDNVVFITRGPVSAWSTLLWPHRWQLDTGSPVMLNNKRVYDYNLQIQEHLPYNNVGVLCHEFCHTLGFPDLYNYDNLGWQIVGPWDVMGRTINPPSHMGAHMKWKYGHWIQSIPEISAHDHTYTLNPLTSPNNNAYRINSPNTNDEYFIVEYRDLNGTFEGSLTDLDYTPGMLIYRINTNAGDGNAHGTPEVYIYRRQSHNTASYSSQTGRTEINMTTDPAPLLSDGSDGGLQINGVGPAGSTISFRLGPPPAKIHGHIASASLPDNVNITDLLVTLRRTDTHRVVSQTRPYWFQAIEYDLYADPGNYYIEYEIFNPSASKLAYPIQSGNIPVEADTWINDITLPEVNLTFIAYNIHNVRVSSNVANPYFKDIMTALQRIQTAVNSGYNGTTVTLDVFPGDYYWPDNNYGYEYLFDYENTNNSALSLIIRGSSALNNPTNIEPRSNQFRFRINRTNILFQNITFSRVMNQDDYYIRFYEQSGSSYSFTGCFFGREEYSEYPGSSMFFDAVSNISLDNCRFKYNKNNGLGVLRFTDCTDVSITGSIFDSNSAKFGGAIHVNECDDVNISDCSFSSNYSSDNNYESIEDGTEGGAIYIYGSQNIDIENNLFVNNRASGGGGPLFMGNCSMFSIVGNMFKDNYNDHLGLDFQGSFSFTLDQCQIDETKKISNNIIKAVNNPSEDSHSILLGSGNTGNLKISNFVFDIDHPQGHVDDNHDFLSYSDVNVLFNNCVFDTGSEAVRFVTPANSTITVSNSLFSNVPQGVTSLLNTHCNIDDMGLDEDYRPIWNTAMKSPCIDNGNPDTNGDGETWLTDHGDRDADGTQMDIGAIPLIDGHIHRFHSLTSDKVRYISIPGVVNYPESGEQNLLYHVFHEFRGNGLFETYSPVLEQIRWMYNNDNGIATPNQIPEHYVHSQNGYKVTLTENAQDLLIQYQGYFPNNPMNKGMFIQDLDRYTQNHYILPPGGNSPVDSNTGIPYREIYLGYYLSESLKPFDALNPIMDNVTAILAEDWAMVRLPIFGYSPEPGDEPSDAYTDTWLGCVPTGGREITINPGEMVVVRYIGSDPIEFKLGGDNPNPPFTDPYYREMATHFEYEEQPEYIPIFLSIDLNQFEDGDKPLEVAVFIDEECKGAAVIKEGEVQLNAYITNVEDPTEELKNLEFRMFFPGKAANAHVLDYSVFNKQSGRFESRKISVSECKDFLQIRLGKTEEPPLPSVTKLLGNYPNPFNPETTISFDLAEQCPVTIEVFNIKGQKVRTLVRDSYAPGHHSVVWNGTDAKGGTVSSGVYFYRMITPSNTLIHKMLLMK